MNILVINCGSSSLKFQLIDAISEETFAKGICERIGIEGSQFVYITADNIKTKSLLPMKDHRDAVQIVLNALTDKETGCLSSLKDIGAVGHRLVHGGENFASSTYITEAVLKATEACNELAPLHNPANLIGIQVCKDLMKEVPMVAVFDTAFHQTMPEEAYLYGIPYKYYEKHKIRRYGFHGTSHSYVSHRAAELLHKNYEDVKIIVCHLGNGASISAVKKGKCVDTSMGMTPLEGLIMGTRSGDIDPAIIEFLMEKEQLSIHEVVNILNKQSGIMGLFDGTSSDFRDLQDAYYAGDPAAIRTMKAFVYRIAKYVGSYVAAMNGVDAICFTAGIGENCALVRTKVCEYLGYLGIEIQEDANKIQGEETVISTPESRVTVLVIPTNEELTIARETYAIVKE